MGRCVTVHTAKLRDSPMLLLCLGSSVRLIMYMQIRCDGTVSLRTHLRWSSMCRVHDRP